MCDNFKKGGGGYSLSLSILLRAALHFRATRVIVSKVVGSRLHGTDRIDSRSLLLKGSRDSIVSNEGGWREESQFSDFFFHSPLGGAQYECTRVYIREFVRET